MYACTYYFYYSFTSVVASSVTVSTVSSTTGASVSIAGASSGAWASSTTSSLSVISFVSILAPTCSLVLADLPTLSLK